MSRGKFGYPGIYNATPDTLTDGDPTALLVDSSGRLVVSGLIATGDIEIGAVELKDGTTDARVSAKVDNAAAGTPTPLSVGGKYNASAPTYDDGDQVTTQYDVNGNLKVTSATLIAGEDLASNVLKTEQQVSYANISADTAVKSGAGRFFGFIVNSHSSGTLKIWDALSATTPILLNTITFAAGPQSWVFPVGINFTTGLYADVGGTIDVTILYK